MTKRDESVSFVWRFMAWCSELNFRFVFLFGLLLTLLLFGSFYVGVSVACDGGYRDGFTCVEPKELGVCVYDDALVVVEPGGVVTGSDLVVGYESTSAVLEG